MTAEVAVRTHLAANAGIIALVGARVYTERLPEHPTLPAIRVQLIVEMQAAHLRGGSTSRPARIQVDALAEETSGADPYTSATALADAVDAALMGVAAFVVGGLELKIVERPSRLPVYDPEELRQVKIAQDYVVWSRIVS